MVKRLYKIIIISLVFVVVTGCDDSQAETNSIVTYEAIEATAEYLDNPSSDRRRIEIIGVKQDLIASLNHYSHTVSEEAVNKIDFETQQVVFVSLGLSYPRRELAVTGIKRSEEYISLQLRQSVACATCVVSQVATYPMYLIIIDSRKPVILQESMNILF